MVGGGGGWGGVGTCITVLGYFNVTIINFVVIHYLFMSCFVVVVVLLFYVHGKHLRSCRDSQLT